MQGIYAVVLPGDASNAVLKRHLPLGYCSSLTIVPVDPVVVGLGWGGVGGGGGGSYSNFLLPLRLCSEQEPYRSSIPESNSCMSSWIEMSWRKS